MLTTPDAIIQDTKKRMHSSIETLKKEMATIRTGRAHASLLDTVHVEYYGSNMPLTQLATITVPESSLLVIQPFDKSSIKAIETGILKSELGLNPANDGNVIRLPIPALTEERRKELVKVLHKLGEEIKTAVRNVRRDSNEHLKKIEKDGTISQDEHAKLVKDVQGMTDEHVKQIDQLLQVKENDILHV